MKTKPKKKTGSTAVKGKKIVKTTKKPAKKQSGSAKSTKPAEKVEKGTAKIKKPAKKVGSSSKKTLKTSKASKPDKKDSLTGYVKSVIDSYGGTSDSLVSVLQDIQSEYRYLPEAAIRAVAQILGLPLVQVYGVATFFKAFSLTPKGERIIHVCMGTACHVRGAPFVLSELERQFNVKSGETTKDNKVTLETVNCLGACALGPVVVDDGIYHGQMTTGKVKEILSKHEKTSREKGHEKIEISA